MYKNVRAEDVEFLRGSEVYHRCHSEFGANVIFEKATLVGFSKTGKRVQIIKADRSMLIKLENIFERQEKTPDYWTAARTGERAEKEEALRLSA